MSIIQTIESAMIDKIKSVLMVPGNEKVRLVETLPGAWSYDIMKRVLQKSPSVYVSFLGGNRGTNIDDLACINATLDVYVVRKDPDEEARRVGTPQHIGCYDMLAAIIPNLHGYTIDGAGSLKLIRVGVLFGQDTFELGGSVYVASFELPNLVFDAEPPNLNGFITFNATHTLAVDAPTAIDQTTLAQ